MTKEPCKYCISKSGVYDDVDYIDYDDDDYFFMRIMDEDCINVDCKDGIDTIFFINYCPMCGRKLKTE